MIQLVKYYMTNLNQYKLNNGQYWDNFKMLEMKNKSSKYVQKISDLIDEWVEIGESEFCKKYNI